jgi:hypothetical protein
VVLYRQLQIQTRECRCIWRESYTQAILKSERYSLIYLQRESSIEVKKIEKLDRMEAEVIRVDHLHLELYRIARNLTRK